MASFHFVKALSLIIQIEWSIDVNSPQNRPGVDLVRLALCVESNCGRFKSVLLLERLRDRIFKNYFLLQVTVQILLKILKLRDIVFVASEVKKIRVSVFSKTWLEVSWHLFVTLL